MIYTLQTKKALKLCFEAHKAQTDKSGLPYVFHPFHLAEQMQDEDTVVAALLHDVVEDTQYTIGDIEKMGFSREVISALLLLTHDKSTAYFDYVRKIKDNPIARAVKLADLKHNSDLSRLDNVTEEDKLRALKYKIALCILEEHKMDSDGIYSFSMPLDFDNLYFLSVFYKESGPEEYSLDAEYADDAHYLFPAKYSEEVRQLLPAAESLPEALIIYLRNNNEENFAELLYENGIPVKGYHFYSM